MKILHSADWHLDAPLSGRCEEEARFLRRQLRSIPAKVVQRAKHMRFLIGSGGYMGVKLSELIELYILNGCLLFYLNYTSMRLNLKIFPSSHKSVY